MACNNNNCCFEPRGATAGARRFLRPGTRLLARRSRLAVYLEDRASRRTGTTDRARARGGGGGRCVRGGVRVLLTRADQRNWGVAS